MALTALYLFLLFAAGTAGQPVGSLVCWGQSPWSTVPPGLGLVLELDVGEKAACVRAASEPGRPSCWGNDDVALVPAALVDVEQVYVGGWHACAKRQSGHVSCWGATSEGSMQAEVGVVEDLSLGWYTTLAVQGGAVRCWGHDTDGQCSVPADLGSARLVAAGGRHSCAVLQDRSVRCWGGNYNGATDVPAGLAGVVKLQVGGYTTCALKEDGAYVCWGKVQGPANTAFDSLVMRGDSICTVAGWQVLQCWGSSGSSDAREVPQGDLLQLGLGSKYGCALRPTTTTTTSTLSTRTRTTTATTSSMTSTATATTMSTSTTMSMTRTETTTTTSSSATWTVSTTVTTSRTSTTTPTVTPTETATQTVSTTVTTSRTATATPTVTRTETVTTTSSSATRTVSTTVSMTRTATATTSSTTGTTSTTMSTITSTVTASSTSTSSSSSSTTTMSSTNLPSPGEAAEALFRAVEGAVPNLLADLKGSNETTVVAALPDGSSMAVTRLGGALEEALAAAVPSIHIEVPGLDVDVTLPATMFAAVGAEEEVAMVVTALDASSSNVKGLGKSADAKDGAKQIEVAGAAVLDLLGLTTGKILSVEGLIEPITFSLPANFTQGMVCAYWNEQAEEWSTEGVWASGSNVPGEKIECKTKHLSLFGAIVQSIIETLLCINVLNLLNTEAMHEVLQGAWLASMGAAMLGAVFLMLAFAFAVAAYFDHRRETRQHWEDGFLMIYKPEPLPPPEVAEEPKASGGVSQMCMGGVMSGICACCLSDVTQQAAEDIASNWCQSIGEIRTAIETCCDFSGLNLEAFGTCVISALTHKLAAKMMMFVSRRNTAARLGMNVDMVTFVLEDEDLADYLVEERSHSNGVNWRMNQSQAEAWAGLREEISNGMVQNIVRQGRRRPLDYLKTVCMLCLTENPLGALFVHDIFCSCKQRVFIFSAELLGSLAVSCLFFERTGLAQGKPRRGSVECGDDDGGMDLGKSIGRFFVVALGCLLVAGIPVQILSSLQTKSLKVMREPPGSEAWKKQLRAWRFQERLVTVLGLLYNALCSFYIITFIANMGNGDQLTWSITGALALFQDMLLLPFVAALSVPLMAQAVLTLHLCVSTVSTDHFTRQVCEIFHETSNAMLPIERL